MGLRDRIRQAVDDVRFPERRRERDLDERIAKAVAASRSALEAPHQRLVLMMVRRW